MTVIYPKKLRVCAGILIFVSAVLFSSSVSAAPVCFDGLQALRFTDLDGNAVSIPDNRSRVLLMNLWATWCGPCRREIAHINTVYDTYRSKAVDFIGISLDTLHLKQIKGFKETMGIQYPVFIGDPASLMKALSIVGVPATVIFDRDREKSIRLIGVHTPEELSEVLNTLLDDQREKDPK